MTNRHVFTWQVFAAQTKRVQVTRFLGQCLVGCLALALLTYLGFELGANSLTIGFLFIAVVLVLALRFGFWAASFTSVVAAASLDYFFLLPLFSFRVADPQGWVALAVFQFAALTVSTLSARELKHAREAAIHRNGMAQLYELSRCSLLLDMHQAPGPQLVVLIHRIFGAEAVAMFDLHLGRQDRMGEWGQGEEDLAKQCYLHDASGHDKQIDGASRMLRAGSGPVGALVVRGSIDPLVVDAVASLAEIAIDRHQWFEKEERAETSRKSEELRSAVMDALAHEFKTPLTAVQTASSGLLALGGLSSSQSDLAAVIEKEAVRLNELCTRLLRAAKLDAQRLGLKTVEVNIGELIQEVLAAREMRGDKDRVQIVLEEPVMALQADRGLLAMILAQFIENARKYATPGTPIEVKVRKSHTEMLISVHNVGSTIRIEDRERIFDRFYRAADMMESVPGTGIGLSVVKKAAEAHHGHVWVISEEKEGTTFFLSLPWGVRRNH
jgi:two-component system, OmpR family, sensor histidine kinase KdpD